MQLIDLALLTQQLLLQCRLLSLPSNSQLLQCPTPLLLVVEFAASNRAQLALQLRLTGEGGEGDACVTLHKSSCVRSHLLQLQHADLGLQLRLRLSTARLPIASKLRLHYTASSLTIGQLRG